MRVLAVLVALVMIPLVSMAETRFVEVEVTLRTGQGTGFSIIRMVRSGTPVEVLEADRGAGYTRVRIPGGTEGWLLSRYLTETPVGAEELVTARQRIDQLVRENRGIAEERDRYLKEADSLAEELARLKDLSANALSLEETNQKLRSTLTRGQAAIDQLRSENERYKSKTRRDWFLAGSGVMAFGIFLGVILPRIRWRRKRTWSDL